MKTSANKNTDSKHSASNSFFNKGNKDSFFSADHDSSFFPGPEVLQTKLSVGAPNDPYEREADRMADQVVSNSKTTTPKNGFESPNNPTQGLRKKSLAENITPVVQRKPAFESPGILDQDSPASTGGFVQRMPAFESPGPMDQESGIKGGAFVQTKAMPAGVVQLQSADGTNDGSSLEGQLQ